MKKWNEDNDWLILFVAMKDWGYIIFHIYNQSKTRCTQLIDWNWNNYLVMFLIISDMN